MTPEDLLEILGCVKKDELKKFKWHLNQPASMKPYQALKESALEEAEDRQDIVDLMVKTFELHGALEVTRKVLQKIPRNDLVQRLPDTSSGPEGDADAGETSENRGASTWQSKGARRSCGPSALERLFDIRSGFVDRISGAMLKSLLDKLLEKRVMTDTERESADEMPNRTDKARFVIDTVRNKGEAAGSVMIEFLREADPFLCEHLGLM